MTALAQLRAILKDSSNSLITHSNYSSLQQCFVKKWHILTFSNEWHASTFLSEIPNSYGHQPCPHLATGIASFPLQMVCPENEKVQGFLGFT